MYQCLTKGCQITFPNTIELSGPDNDEWYNVCPQCLTDNYEAIRPKRESKIRSATEKMLHCQLRYGIELDYLNSGRIETLFENNLTIRNMTRYTILSKHYLNQLQP
jgi:histidinol phosphatase-like PHP family hydrolase